MLHPVVTGGGVASGAGNVIAGGLIGIGVDAGTGANLDLRPNPMAADLKPAGSAESSRVVYANEEEKEEAYAAAAKARAKVAEKTGATDLAEMSDSDDAIGDMDAPAEVKAETPDVGADAGEPESE